VGPIFLGLLWDIKIVLRSKDSGSRIAGSGGGKIIFFFWPLNSMIFLIFYDLKKKSERFIFDLID